MLVSLVGYMYLILNHVISVFSLLITNALAVASIHIHISHIIILSHSQHHYFRLNNFKIYFVDNKFEKIIA
jgi:hypothetical protein